MLFFLYNFFYVRGESMRKKKCRQPLDISIFSFFPSIAKLMVLDLEPFTSEINAEIIRSSCGGSKSHFLIFCPRHPMTIVFCSLKMNKQFLQKLGICPKASLLQLSGLGHYRWAFFWIRSLSLDIFSASPISIPSN